MKKFISLLCALTLGAFAQPVSTFNKLANPQTAAGYLVQGASAPLSTFGNGAQTPREQILGTGSSGTAGIGLARFANDASGGMIELSSSRGTTVGSYTIAQSGDAAGTIFFGAADGTDFARLGYITGTVDGTPGNNDMPGKISVFVSPDGTVVPVEMASFSAVNGIALTALGTNQNITLTPSGTGAVNLGTGTLIGTGATSFTGGAGNMTITSGTGNSRTLTFRTTTSGGVATNALILGATQGATLTGNLTYGTAGAVLSGTTGSQGINMTGASQGFTLQSGSANTYFNLLAPGGEAFINFSAVSVTSGQRSWRLGPTNSSTGGGTANSYMLQRMNNDYSGVTDTVFAVTPGLFAFSSSYNVSLGGAYIGSTSTLSGAGAANVTTETTKLTTAGVGDAITLANGVDGQTKIIVLDVLTSGGHTAVLTPTTKTGFSTVTFNAAGQTVTLKYYTTRGWMVVGSYLATIAP